MNVKLIGHDLNSLHVELSPNERFFCEKGAIIYYEDGIHSTLKVLDNGVMGMIKRKLSGESVFMMELGNAASTTKKLVVAGRLGLLPVNLKNMNGGIICRGGKYVASSDKVDIDFKLNVTSMIGGTGLLMQKITGNCTVFLDAIGSPITLDLKAGEAVFVDEKAFICMSGHMQNQTSPHFSGANMLGGEGLTMLRIAGPGTVYLNSVNTSV